MVESFAGEKKSRRTPICNSYYDLHQKVRAGQATTPLDLKNQVSKSVSQFLGDEEEDS